MISDAKKNYTKFGSNIVKKNVPSPGIEPRSLLPQSRVLTTILGWHNWLKASFFKKVGASN